MNTYKPPFSITPNIIRLISDISGNLGRLSVLKADQNLRLRRIRTIQGSLAIEGNTLSIDAITALLDGKAVIAPPREIQEARNAIKAYEQFDQWQPENEDHLLGAHQLMMTGLIDDAGHYRGGNVGVMKGKDIVHMAPPANRVRLLMENLLEWIATTDQHPLIVSSVFHYEFEFIHPFADGNGRMGRLWQTLILSQWNPLFAQLPVESMVHEHQSDYYQAIRHSTKNTDSAPFIEFMLSAILNTIKDNTSPQDTPHVAPQVKRLLETLAKSPYPMNRTELQAQLKLKDRKSFRERYLKPALDDGLITMTLPDKPSSRLQQYALTEQGQRLINDNA